jgi:hypothetical protein
MIQLSPEWRIRADVYNLILERLSQTDSTHHMAKVDAEPRWEVIGYYGSLEQLADGLTKHTVRTVVGLSASLSTFVAALNQIKDEVRSRLSDLPI